MSDDRPLPDDPFLRDDPRAAEREARRREREARRRERAQRSLGEKASSNSPQPSPEPTSPEEPARPRRQPPMEPLLDTSPRLSASEAMPVREGTRRRAAAPVPVQEPVEEPAVAATAAATAEAPPREPTTDVPAVAEPPAERPPTGRPRPRASTVWIRRFVAALGLLLIAVVAVAIAKSRNEAPPPVEPSKPIKTESLTLPEGLTRDEMAKLAEKAGLKGSYEDASKKAPKGFDLAEYGAKDAPSLEGFLFPSTYELEKGAPASELVDKQLAAFQDTLAGVDMKYAESKNLSVYDVVTIASMIEREVAVDKERPLVAAVIYNRLADGEPLGIDATLRYEVGFDKPLLESQLESPSPYNTRINPGLPPTPIGNPGAASLEAAANPADVDYKYYVFKPGSCNEHFFTADYDEFVAAQAKYQAALEEQGSQPTDC